MKKNIEEVMLAKLTEYCQEHGLDFSSLGDVLNEPKVVPMIRGIGYEYVILNYLKDLLKDDKQFIAGKTIVNSQRTVKGSDVEVLDRQSKKVIRLECKLAANGSFSIGTRTNNFPHCKVKIMRSRTLGDEMIKRVADEGESTVEQLTAHKDSYLSNSFDFVITNLRNAFYITTIDGIFQFHPSELQWEFLSKFTGLSDRNQIDDFLKKTHYFIEASKLAPNHGLVRCNRRNCPNPTSCQFIPNYPIFNLANLQNWRDLKDFYPKLRHS